MPTMECLEERTRIILKTLDDLGSKITLQHQEIRLYIEARDKEFSAKLKEIEEDIEDLKLTRAEDHGKRSMLIFMGGIALAAISGIFGAIGNILYQWATSAHGLIKLG